MADHPVLEEETLDSGKESDRIVKDDPDQITGKYAGLSESERTELLAKLKGYDADYTRKTQEVSRRLKALSEREAEVKDVAEKLHSASKTNPNLSQAKAEGRRILDSLIDSAPDPQARETLRQLKDIIREETDVESLKKEVTELKGLLKVQSDSLQSDRIEQLNTGLKQLRETYGDDLVDKFTDPILYWGTQGAQFKLSARKLLHSLADPDELLQALRVQEKKKGTNGKEPEKPKVTSSAARPDSDKFREGLNKPGGGTKAVRAAVAEVIGKFKGLPA